MMRTPKFTHPYYRFDKILSYNATFNFVVGARGVGKTYGAKERAIKRAINNGEQFIYLRRYKSELKSRMTFFDDIAHKFPDYDFRAQGNFAQISHASEREWKKRNWITIGYFVALSTSQANKSIAYPLVTSIIFDEFIIEKGTIRYLPDETNVFNNFYSTVDRYQDKTRVFFLANSVSIMNPYFLSYEIYPDEEKEFVVRANGFIVCHFPKSEYFKASIYETRFGRFIKDTNYADYAVGNNFSDNNNNLLDLKDPEASYMYSLETAKGKFSIWYNGFTNIYYVQNKLPKEELIFTMRADNMSEDKIFITYNDKPLQALRTAWRIGNVFFDMPSTRNACVEIFKR